MSGAAEYVTKTVYDEGALAAGQLVLEHRDPELRKGVRKSRGLVLLLGVILIFGGVTSSGAPGLVLIMAGAAVGLLAAFYRQFLFLLARRSVTGEEETASFHSDRFFLKSVRREEGHSYDELESICRSGHYLFLFVSRDRSYVVDTDGLRSGTPKEFELFLTAKTGLIIDGI